MSIAKAQVANLVVEVSDSLIGSPLHTLKNTGSRTFLFEIGSRFLLICLQEPLLGFFLATQKYEKGDSPFSHELYRYLKGSLLTSISQLNDDRILQLTFGPYRLIIEFFPKRPNLYLVDSQDQILLALNPISEKSYLLPNKPSPQIQEAPTLSSRELEQEYREALFLHEKQRRQQVLQQRLKLLLKSESV